MKLSLIKYIDNGGKTMMQMLVELLRFHFHEAINCLKTPLLETWQSTFHREKPEKNKIYCNGSFFFPFCIAILLAQLYYTRPLTKHPRYSMSSPAFTGLIFPKCNKEEF
ncbi:hypothetical protein FKM82_002354 [Ascaphus truei]